MNLLLELSFQAFYFEEELAKVVDVKAKSSWINVINNSNEFESNISNEHASDGDRSLLLETSSKHCIMKRKL